MLSYTCLVNSGAAARTPTAMSPPSLVCGSPILRVALSERFRIPAELRATICRLNQRLPMPGVRRPVAPPNQRHVAEREPRHLLQSAERDVLDKREDVALEAGEVDELAVLLVPISRPLRSLRAWDRRRSPSFARSRRARSRGMLGVQTCSRSRQTARGRRRAVPRTPPGGPLNSSTREVGLSFRPGLAATDSSGCTSREVVFSDVDAAVAARNPCLVGGV